MASTRSKNTPGNYKLEQRANILSKKYDLYQHSQHGSPYKTAIPSIGYTPSFISRDALSTNPIDIESALEERLTLNDFGHNTSTGIHFKLIDEGLRIAFSDLKIFQYVEP